MTPEEILILLPEKIIWPEDDPIDEFDDEYWYFFKLGKKEDDEFELSYYCWLYDKELVSFTGNLRDVTSKMYSWCKERKYC